MSPRDGMTPAPVPEGAVEAAAGPPVSHPGSGPAVAPEIEIPLTCVVHGDPARVVVRREDGRVVLDVDGLDCCILAIQDPALTVLFDVLGEWLG